MKSRNGGLALRPQLLRDAWLLIRGWSSSCMAEPEFSQTSLQNSNCTTISEFEGEEAAAWYFTQDCSSANLEQWFSRICVWVLIGAENKIGKEEMRRRMVSGEGCSIIYTVKCAPLVPGVPFKICKSACWSETKVQISNLQITSLFTCFLKR